MLHLRKIVTVTVTVTALAVATFVLATGTAAVAGSPDGRSDSDTAVAASRVRNGVCDDGEFCLYHLSDFRGSISDFWGDRSIPNYGATQPHCYEFRTPTSDGWKQCVKNNAASAWNRTDGAVRVYSEINYGRKGYYQTIPVGKKLNLVVGKLKKHNGSHWKCTTFCITVASGP